MPYNNPHGRRSYHDSSVPIRRNNYSKDPSIERDEPDGNTMSKMMKSRDDDELNHLESKQHRWNQFTHDTQLEDDEDDFSDYDDHNTSTSSTRSQENISQHQSHTKDVEKESNSIFMYFITFLLIILIALVVNFYPLLWTNDQIEETNTYNYKNFRSDMEKIVQKYDLDNTKLLTVLHNIHKNENAGSLMFVYNMEKNRNIGELNDLVKSIAQVTVKYLRNASMVDRLPYTKGYTLLPNNEDDLIKYYRQPVNDAGVMVVQDISKIPQEQAQKFHHFCDEYNPVVKRSAIFFTLDLRECSTTADSYHKNPIHVIERCLNDKWREMNSDLRAALLTRVIEVIIDIS